MVTVGLASDRLGRRGFDGLGEGKGSKPENSGEVSDLHFVWLSASKTSVIRFQRRNKTSVSAENWSHAVKRLKVGVYIVG